MAFILDFNSGVILSGKSLSFLRLNANTTEAIPTKMKDKAVMVTKEIPVNIGLANNNRDKIMPSTLVMAAFPQFNIFKSFISNEKPSNWKERKSIVNPTKKGRTAIEILGYMAK